MSDDMANDSGRVTTAMVFRAIDDQGKLMTAQNDAVRSEIRSVHHRLDSLAQLPDRVTRLESSVQELQEQSASRTTFKATVLPGIIIGSGTLIVGLLPLLLR